MLHPTLVQGALREEEEGLEERALSEQEVAQEEEEGAQEEVKVAQEEEELAQEEEELAQEAEEELAQEEEELAQEEAEELAQEEEEARGVERAGQEAQDALAEPLVLEGRLTIKLEPVWLWLSVAPAELVDFVLQTAALMVWIRSTATLEAAEQAHPLIFFARNPLHWSRCWIHHRG